MSRFMALIISLMYVGGGLVTGYYAYAFRAQHYVEGAGIDPAVVAQFFQGNYFAVGPLVLILAAMLHFKQIANARKNDAGHVETEHVLEEEARLARAELQANRRDMEEQQRVMNFCREAIADAAARDLRKPDGETVLMETSNTTQLIGKED